MRRALIATALVGVLSAPALAQIREALPRAKTPEEVGLSSERLERVRAVTARHIETVHVPGAVTLVARHGKIAYFESLGFRDRAAPGLGFGLGFQVRREAGVAGLPGSMGEYGWAVMAARSSGSTRKSA